jgi:NADH-quinone oxidoreductase subunit J
MPGEVTNTAALGRLLYTDYVYLFQAAGLILLVAMIGAIVLTHRERPGTRRQSIPAQVTRRDSVVVQQVPIGAGIAELGILRPPPKEEPKPVEHAADHGHGGHH